MSKVEHMRTNHAVQHGMPTHIAGQNSGSNPNHLLRTQHQKDCHKHHKDNTKLLRGGNNNNTDGTKRNHINFHSGTLSV
jgi:hypothetical protein